MRRLQTWYMSFVPHTDNLHSFSVKGQGQGQEVSLSYILGKCNIMTSYRSQTDVTCQYQENPMDELNLEIAEKTAYRVGHRTALHKSALIRRVIVSHTL